MFSWLFDSKKQKVAKKQVTDDWAYESIVQFLLSKQLKGTINQFIDQKCVFFDPQEQNKLQYTIIFKEFTSLITVHFDQYIINEVGISKQKCQECIRKGLKDKINKNVFQQLMLLLDFQSFTRLMVQRNKALTKQVLRQLQTQQLAQKESKELQMAIKQSKKQQNLSQEQMILLAIKLSLQESKSQVPFESKQLQQMDARRRRLMAQRQLILKNKAKSQKKSEQECLIDPGISAQQKQTRSKLMRKIRQQIQSL